MKNIFLLIFALISLTISAQEKFTISGYTKDAKNGESLKGVTVFKKIHK